MQTMTPLEDVAQGVRDYYGITSRTAAMAVVTAYVDQIADDAELYDPNTNSLTEEGANFITTAICAGFDAELFSTADGALLEALEITVRTQAENLAARDELIRSAMRTSLPRAKIAAAARLSEARLYQV